MEYMIYFICQVKMLQIESFNLKRGFNIHIWYMIYILEVNVAWTRLFPVKFTYCAIVWKPRSSTLEPITDFYAKLDYTGTYRTIVFSVWNDKFSSPCESHVNVKCLRKGQTCILMFFLRSKCVRKFYDIPESNNEIESWYVENSTVDIIDDRISTRTNQSWNYTISSRRQWC